MATISGTDLVALAVTLCPDRIYPNWTGGGDRDGTVLLGVALSVASNLRQTVLPYGAKTVVFALLHRRSPPRLQIVRYANGICHSLRRNGRFRPGPARAALGNAPRSRHGRGRQSYACKVDPFPLIELAAQLPECGKHVRQTFEVG